MQTESALRAALSRLLPPNASRFRDFVVADAQGRMRIGVLATDAGLYAEVSNFLAPPADGQADYIAPWPEQPGLFRFTCDVDLFYSDIDQIMAMSRAAAEAALRRAG
jgi:hypothetical protein